MKNTYRMVPAELILYLENKTNTKEVSKGICSDQKESTLN